MPIYEYRCQACGEQFDKLFRSLGQVPDEVECPACHSTTVQRLMSAPAVHSGESSGIDVEGLKEMSSSSTPPIFGRKELKKAEEKKRQLKEQAKYEAKQTKKKKG